MKAFLAVCLAIALSGCAGGGSGLSEVGSSFRGGSGGDTYGTNRRPDVYGGSTAPSLPTIGAPGFGK